VNSWFLAELPRREGLNLEEKVKALKVLMGTTKIHESDYSSEEKLVATEYRRVFVPYSQITTTFTLVQQTHSTFDDLRLGNL
jgi:hypothetical protein